MSVVIGSSDLSERSSDAQSYVNTKEARGTHHRTRAQLPLCSRLSIGDRVLHALHGKTLIDPLSPRYLCESPKMGMGVFCDFSWMFYLTSLPVEPPACPRGLLGMKLRLVFLFQKLELHTNASFQLQQEATSGSWVHSVLTLSLSACKPVRSRISDDGAPQLETQGCGQFTNPPQRHYRPFAAGQLPRELTDIQRTVIAAVRKPGGECCRETFLL